MKWSLRPARRSPAYALVVVALAAALTSACGGGGSSNAFQGTELAKPVTLPAGTFTDTAGTSYDPAAQARGHLTLLYFGYTNCPDICPTTMADLGAALRSVPQKVADNVRVVFVTSDPARDTPAVMKSWLANFDEGLQHPFVGLTSDVNTIDNYAKQVGVPLLPPKKEKDGTISVEHGAQVLAFSAQDGKAHLVWLPGLTPKQYAADIEKLAKSVPA